MIIGINALFLAKGSGGGMERHLSGMTAAMALLAPPRSLRAFTCKDGPALPNGVAVHEQAPVRARWRPGKLLWEQAALPSRAKQAQCGVMISFGNTCPLALPCPSILVLHDLIPLDWPGEFSAMERLAAGLLFRASARAADHIVTVSEFAKSRITQRLKVPPDKVTVIPGACDPVFARPEPSPDWTGAPANGAGGEPYILASASSKPHKNLSGLLEAFKIFAKTAAPPKLRLVITHTAGTDKHVLAMAQRLGLGDRVQATGPISDQDLALLYRGATLFVYPSLYEGFGLPILEAMASGTPVVASQAASLPEVAGQAALLADASDPEKLARAMAQALTDEKTRQTCIREGLKRAEAFSWDKSARMMMALVWKAGAGGFS